MHNKMASDRSNHETLMVRRRFSAVSGRYFASPGEPRGPAGAIHPSRRRCAAPQDEVWQIREGKAAACPPSRSAIGDKMMGTALMRLCPPYVMAPGYRSTTT